MKRSKTEREKALELNREKEQNQAQDAFAQNYASIKMQDKDKDRRALACLYEQEL